MEKINAEKVPFSQAAPFLNQSLSGDDKGLRLECESGLAQCWKFKDGQAYMLARVEDKELVICCFEGRGLAEIASHIISAAKSNGFSSIRFHTKRPALAKLINQHFEHVEHVFKRLL